MRTATQQHDYAAPSPADKARCIFPPARWICSAPPGRPTGNRHYRRAYALCRRAPEHSYSRLGAQNLYAGATGATSTLTPAARSWYGDAASRRTSVSRRFWHIAFNSLSSPEVPVWLLSAQRICVVVGVGRITGFPCASAVQRRCANATQRGNRRNHHELDVLRDTRRNSRAVNIARLLDNEAVPTTAVRRAVANSDNR